jgi:hypothetical protein
MRMPFTDAQLKQYDDEGAVMIDSPFTTDELDRAESAWDRIKEGDDPPYEGPGYLEIVQHPLFEEVAKKVLRADAVHLWWGVSPHERPPWKNPFDSPEQQWKNGCHSDI